MENKNPEQTVSMVYLAQVCFDEAQTDPNDEAYLDVPGLVDQALHNVAENVRAAAQYTEFDDPENFEAIITHDTDLDHKDVVRQAAYAMLIGAPEPKPTSISIDEDGVLVADEYELHDWITSLLHTDSMPSELVGPDGETHFNAVTIDWQGFEDESLPTEEKRAELQKAYDKVINAIGELDSLHHDICEYTC